MKPYYSDDLVTIYHGDCLEGVGWVAWSNADVLVTDPPYGIAYQGKRHHRVNLPESIVGDEDTGLRDRTLELWGSGPALVFGTWRRPRPGATRMLLVWDTNGALGMGPTDLPWKPSHQEIYVLGKGFTGHRGTDVLRYAPVQGMARNGRTHPHEKPVPLMRDLIRKCPPGIIADPFMGSGATLVAAKSLNRQAVGIEIDERYCEIAARRCSQEVLGLSA